jgi:hypothetical protein
MRLHPYQENQQQQTNNQQFVFRALLLRGEMNSHGKAGER